MEFVFASRVVSGLFYYLTTNDPASIYGSRLHIYLGWEISGMGIRIHSEDEHICRGSHTATRRCKNNIVIKQRNLGLDIKYEVIWKIGFVCAHKLREYYNLRYPIITRNCGVYNIIKKEQ